MSNPEEEADAIETELRMREAMRLNPLELEEVFVRLPAEIAWVSAQYAHAIGAHLRAKARAKRLRGLLEIRVREELEDAGVKGGGKRPTESMVDARVEQLPEWQEAQEEEIAADVAREVARGRLSAIMAKKDSAVQLGAAHRAELERDPVIRKRFEEDRIRQSEYQQKG